MAKDDPMDVPRVVETMTKALQLQWRSVVLYSAVAAGLTGPGGTGLAERLGQYASAELADAARLAEKLVALGGSLPTDVPRIPLGATPAKSLAALADADDEAIAGLHAVIEHSGQEPRSEALEHLLEHLILRKQQQVDLLRRALAD